MILGIALAIIPTTIISFIIHEKENHLKHMQITSGVSISAYWVSNYIFDLLKTGFQIGLILILSEVSEIEQPEGLWQSFVLFVPVIVSFTYMISLCFKKQLTAQIVTLFTSYLFGGIMACVWYFLKRIPTDGTQLVADKLRWIFQPLPTYAVCQGLILSKTHDQLSLTDGVFETFSMDNLKGNYMFMIGTGTISLLILIIVEAGLLNYFARCTLRSLPSQ